MNDAHKTGGVSGDTKSAVPLLTDASARKDHKMAHKAGNIFAVESSPTDIRVENHGSIFLLRPVSPSGQFFLDTQVIGEETQVFGGAVVVEPRYVEDIVRGARGEGLFVR